MKKLTLGLLGLVGLAAAGCGDNLPGRAGPVDAAVTEADAAVFVKCGDGFVDPPEQCDDGDEIADMVCTADCRFTCGNGVVDTTFGELCDPGIASGPGACPQSCDDGNACTTDVLVSAGCETTCMNEPITAAASGDGCCPPGATAATDSDCPAVCGDGVVTGGELCDTALASGPGACPTACNDGMACTRDLLTGTGCMAACSFPAITAPANGDGCCPPGATPANDNDCRPTCGNGVLDSGELCDPGITSGPGKCPTSCDDGMSCTADALSGGGTCQALCTHTAITAPANNDGCCPPGATSATDNDCRPGCGNGVVDPGETCDTAITAGAGRCPTTCSDGMACTTDRLVNGGTCTAACTFTPITTPASGDGCCPAGANANSDSDCAPRCGNGVVERGELCDTAIASGTGACPTACNDGMACTSDRLTGSACTAACTFTPITTPVSGDGCCPPGATAATDSDCAPAPPTAFRMSNLDLRDPHTWVNALGCRDVTDTAFFGFSVNGSLQTSIQTDASMPPDGILDLSPTLVFRPLNQMSGGTTAAEVYFASCTTPLASTVCHPGTMAAIMTTATNNASGNCLAPTAGTIKPYTPAITSTSQPCFSTGPITITITLAGVPVTLHDARVAATYSGNPAANLVNGLVMGFISETDANATILPASLPLVGGQPLSSLLPGGTGNCAAGDDRDMDGNVRGWWFYLNFPAKRVTWVEP